VTHDREFADEDVEELAEELWTLGEEGRNRRSDLEATSQVRRLDEAVGQLVARGLGRVEADRVLLTGAGRALAERQVRRHRLAEALFTTALDVRDDAAVNRTACVMEHVLGAAMTDSVCAFLGHPRSCPHGKPIPPGPCCRTFSHAVEALDRFDRLAPGQSGRIVYIVPREPGRLVRLAGLGVVPGAVVQLQQKSPAAVLRVGETTLALDPAIAAEIYVRRVDESSAC
jgi:DtxR family transcriptional regulator, Mn-dependent transcriptional regulator